MFSQASYNGPARLLRLGARIDSTQEGIQGTTLGADGGEGWVGHNCGNVGILFTSGGHPETIVEPLDANRALFYFTSRIMKGFLGEPDNRIHPPNHIP